MVSLFAYGTLMWADIMCDVSGCTLCGEPARLTGFQRLCVRHEHYPAIVPAEQEHVDGILYRDVPAGAWARLDAFEGEMYEPRPVQVQTLAGEPVTAATYVARPQFRNRLEDREWDPEVFRHNGKDAFQQHYPGYRRLP